MKRWVLLIAACGSHAADETGHGAAGKAVGAGIAAAIAAAHEVAEPWRCAQGPMKHVAIAAKLPAKILVIDGARGASDTTVAALSALRKALDAAPVDLVISLGGMGATEEEETRALAPLAQGAPWTVVAIPSDRESIAEHRAAVAALGANVIDGSDARVIELGGIAIGTLPGEPFVARLGAGSEGCLRSDADAAAILAALPADHTKILAVMDPPRGADDLAPGGVHAGDLGLAHALAGSPVDLVLHAAVDDASTTGTVRHGTPGFAAAGAIDATPRYRSDGSRVLPTSLLVTVGEHDVAWKPLAPRVVP